MNFSLSLKSISGFALAVMLVTQLLFVANVMLMPKPAEAVFGVLDTTIIVGNIYDALKDVAIGAAKQVALRFVDGFLTRFMNKVVEKYRIRNFVYYDQVLSDYYLTNYIRDKISDPDLRNIFLLLDSAYVAGNNTGLSGYNPNNALIPQLKKKISDLYIANGGVDPDLIENPPANISSYNYYSASYNYYLNPPSYTQQNLLGQYGSLQSSATTAAQLEVLVGDGYKSGRLLGGSCTIASSSSLGQVTDPASDPSTCAQSGGTWNPSAADYARSFIDNPGQFAHDFVNESINVLMGNNFDPNNIWSAVGSLLGNFLYNKLALNSNLGVLPDGGPAFQTTTAGANVKELDLDGDGITDAYDFDNNNTPDACVFQGVAPNCVGSVQATTSPATPPGAVSCTPAPNSHGNDAGAPGTVNINNTVFEQGNGVGGWAQTGNISSVSVSPTTITINYDKANVWPPIFVDVVQADAVGNPWIFVWRGGQWHATTFSWLRPGQTSKDVGDVFCGGGGGSQTFGDFVPTPGETYGFMVSGIARVNQNNVQERTNVFMFTWPSSL